MVFIISNYFKYLLSYYLYMSNELTLYNHSQISLPTKIKKGLDNILAQNLYPNKETVYEIIKRKNPDITIKQVSNYLKSLVPYQLTHERHQTKETMGHLVSYKPWSIVQIDLLDMQKYGYDYSKFKSLKKLDGIKTNFNKGYKYIMIMIDIFTRYADCVMLKSKNIPDCVESIKIMLDFNKVTPSTIMSDSESSFLSKQFQDFLDERGIKLDAIVLNNHRALGIVDRFCRTLRQRFTKLFIGEGNTEWVEHLATIVYQYNHSPNRGILGYSPIEVLNDKHIQDIILEYNNHKSSKNQNLRSRSNIKVGDKVRLFIENKFKKGSDPSFSNKVYTVKEKIGKNIVLDNNKRVVDHDLLKVGDDQYVDNSLLLENGNEEEKLNPIQEAHKEMKINRKLKQVGLERPTHEVLHEGRKTRDKKIDFLKLSKGK